MSRPASAAIAAPIDVRCGPGFDFGAEDYADLWQRSTATAFQHPLWLMGVHRHLAPARDAEAATIVGRASRDGRLLFVLPLLRRRKHGVMLIESADLGVSDYCAPVISPDLDLDETTRRAVAAALPAHDIVRLQPCALEHARSWSALLGGRVEQLDFSAHAVTLERPYAAWRDRTFEPSFGRQFARKRKRFFKEPGARLRLLTDPGEIGLAIDAIRTLRAGRFEGDPIQADSVAAFYRSIAIDGAPAGLTRTYALMLGDDVLGYTFNVTARGRLHYLLIGCDYERHGRHSPGLILYDGSMEDWLGAGGEVFDFTIGDEPFKADFGTTPTPMHRVIDAATWRGRLALAAFEARRRLAKT